MVAAWSQSLRYASIKQRKVSSGYFSNNHLGSWIKNLLFFLQDHQRELGCFRRVKQRLVVREANDMGVVQVHVFKCWAPEWGDIFSQMFSNQQLWPDQMLEKVQHTLIFGAHVRTLIYLQRFWNGCSAPVQVVVCNRWVAWSSRWWTDLWGCWHWVSYICLSFVLIRGAFAYGLTLNSCDSAFRNHRK